ncbi:patatin-like phospholipase family protein [Luteococcus sediminum]
MVLDLSSNITDTALIFEGGGMRAAYTCAVVQELLAQEMYFDFVAGISAGSSNSLNYVARDAERARASFVDLVLEPEFGSWRTWVRGKGVFNSEFIYEQTGEAGQPLPLDWEAFKANPITMNVGGFNARTGECVYWNKDDDMPDLRAMAKRIRASSTMPGLMPIIQIDGEPWCDGALGPNGGIALDAAKAAGYEKFFVVLTRPAGYRKAPSRLPHAYDVLFRRYPQIARGLLERAENYNRVLDELAELEARGRAYVFRPTHMQIVNQERRIDRLREAHRLGMAQARREVPRWEDFLGR